MRKVPIWLLLSSLWLVACSEGEPEPPAAAAADPSTDGVSETSGPTGAVAESSFCDGLASEPYAGPPSQLLSEGSGAVPGQANIFGAGRSAAPAPKGGGTGVLPPYVELPAGSQRVTFPSVTGEVTPVVEQPGDDGGGWEPNGPEGAGIGPTDVLSYQGISGLAHSTNGMFLVGVFLGESEPVSPAPPRLDFSTTESDVGDVWVGDAFEDLAPEIGQAFMIGDGEGRSYAVPDEATRLFLGFVDSQQFIGCPGFYDNNGGRLEVSVAVS